MPEEKEITKGTLLALRKQPEFLEFLRLVEEEKIPDSWEIIAEAIGVSKPTILKWRKTPEFKEALAKGIKNAFIRMESAGNSDWRMWREKIGLLTKEQNKEELKFGDITINIINYARTNNPV